jgi:hypothetical protein
MKTKILFILISVLIHASCQNNETAEQKKTETSSYSKMKEAEWLLGNWTNQSEAGLAIEHWIKKNDSMFIGESYFIIGNDTASSERMSLEQHGDVMTYNPTVRDQNNNQRIEFTLTGFTEKQLIFENPKHDFPQKIIYNQVNPDSIFAEISGKMNGENKTISFPFCKLKLNS